MSEAVITLIIFGAGGHAAIVIDIARSINPAWDIRLFDGADKCLPVLGHEVESGLPDPKTLHPDHCRVVVAIGEAAARSAVTLQLRELGYSFITLVHPRAYIGTLVTLGHGTVVCANATVNTRAALSDGCIVNTGAIIEHDCRLESFCHVSPGAVLAGGVKLGTQTWIGANAIIKETCTIGANVVVGAGSFVSSDLNNNGTYVGSPACRIN